MLLSRQEWDRWIVSIKTDDYLLAYDVHRKARGWTCNVRRHPWLNRNDTVERCVDCALSSASLVITNAPPGRRCSFTDQRDGLKSVVFQIIPCGTDGRRTHPSYAFTIHENLVLFLECMVFCGSIWIHAGDAAKRDEPGDYDCYIRCLQWVETVLKWIDTPP